MVNKKLLAGMLVMALAFGMAVIGCDNGTTNNNVDDGKTGLPENINTGNPETSDLSAYELPVDFFTTINTAAGGDYQGWYIHNDDTTDNQLQFYWTGRNETQCDAVLAAIRELPDIDDTHGPETTVLSGEQGTGTMRSGNGSYESGAWRYSVLVAVTDCFAWGQNIPKGMLVANFWKETDDGGTTYTVTFNSNGGSNVPATTGIASGNTIALPTVPTKTGNTFSGWYTDNNTFLNEFTSSTNVVDDITVYAKWTLNNGGVFTLKDIPSEYNGKYAVSAENDKDLKVLGAQSIDFQKEEMIGSLISDGTVQMPMWIIDGNETSRYTGDDSGVFGVWIYNQETIPFDVTDDPNLSDDIGLNLTFSNGNVEKSYNDKIDDGGIDPDNPYNNDDPKKIIVQNLPNNGDCILMVSTSSGDNPATFEANVFAIGSAAVSGNAGTFDLKIGTAEGGPTDTNYTKTGDFYVSISFETSSVVSISFETSSVVSKNKIKIDTDTINLQYVGTDWNPISFE